MVEIAQHTAGNGAVNVENIFVFVASVGCGDDVGLPVDGEAYVAEESFVENLVDGFAVIDSRCGSRTTRVRGVGFELDMELIS